MSLFDFFRELSVELPSRVSSLAFAAAQQELGPACAEIRRCREEKARIAREKEEREWAEQHQHQQRDPYTRYKTTFYGPPDGTEEILASLSASENFGRRVQRLVAERCDGNPAVCYKRAGISRQVYSHLISKSPGKVSKETALRIALGLQLSYAEAVDLLASAGFAFSDSRELDVVFAYCLKHEIYSLFDVNELLVAIGFPPLKID